jgi:hypothetical protein
MNKFLIIIIINGATANFRELVAFSVSCSYMQLVGLVGKGISRRQPTTHRTIQTSTPLVEFEPTTPLLERAKIIDALDSAATVFG